MAWVVSAVSETGTVIPTALRGHDQDKATTPALPGQQGVERSCVGVPCLADENRYDVQPYRRCGASGLLLPAVSLGFWHNFGDAKPLEAQRAVARRAFDLAITHFDLANNYGPPFGSAEINAGRILREDFGPYRDELIISTKAGWEMWPGPYGDLGSRKYLTASLINL
jgi:L-glyceraldehyde 3-phosphate reductase